MPVNKSVCFCFAFPLSANSFEEAITDKKKDFIPHFVKFYEDPKTIVDWDFYRDKIVEPYERLKNKFSHYNVDFVDECNFNDFEKVINNLSYKVIIVFSHCINNGHNDESIEFFDELVTTERVLNAMLDIERIYDFSVCKPEYMDKLMKAKRHNAVFGTSCDYIPVILWFYIYAELFALMETDKMDFLDAMYNVRKKYKKKHG
jgi:hypothetical protein